MKPVGNLEIVWHPSLGDRVTVSWPGNPDTEKFRAEKGDGTWTISLHAHILASQAALIGGDTTITEEPVYLPWKQLSMIGAG